MYSAWITLKKPPVTEKSVASFTDQREYHQILLVLFREILGQGMSPVPRYSGEQCNMQDYMVSVNI